MDQSTIAGAQGAGGILAGNGGGSVSAPVESPDLAALRAENESLRRYQTEAQTVFDNLAPHKSLVERVLADEKYRERASRLLDEDAGSFYDESYASYQAIKARQAPQIAPEIKPLYDKFEKFDKFIDGQTERNKIADFQQKQAETKQRVQGDAAVVQELEKSYPFLRDDDYAFVGQMARDAIARQVPFKTVADEFAKRMSAYEFKSKAQGNARPDNTLRSSMGASGVPGPSETKGKADKPFYESALEALRANKRKAG